MRLPRVGAVVALCVLALPGCRQVPPARSLVLVTLDTTRADHLGAYGYDEAETPTFDRLAAEGTLYLRAYSPVPETLPAHASMLTGLYPPSHGVRLNLNFRLPEEAATLAELLRKDGLRTAAVTSASVLASRYGLDQGFEIYHSPLWGERPPELSAEEVTRRALGAADAFGDDAFFLWVHYYDPHAPFEPRPPFSLAEDAPADSPEAYDREIAYMDHWLGELLRGLEERGRIEDAAVIVAGDHGESLGEHGETYHTLFIYEATQRVPLVVRGPRLPQGRRVDELVSSVDVFATAFRLLGREPPAGTSSQPLPGLDLEGGRGADGRRAVFSESMAPPLRFGWAGLQGVRFQQWLYVRAPREELYDLGEDPHERVNLAYAEEELLANLRNVLSRELREMPSDDWSEHATRDVDERERESLEALGYIAAGDGDDPLAEPLEGEDPKDLVEVAESYQLARLARRLDRLETAEELLRFVVAADPENFSGWRDLGMVLMARERPEEAVASLERAVSLRPSDWRSLVGLARAERRAGSFESAEKHLLLALRTVPFPAEIWRELGGLRLAAGDAEAATEAYRQVLALEPGDERAAEALARIAAPGTLDPKTVPGASVAEDYLGSG